MKIPFVEICVLLAGAAWFSDGCWGAESITGKVVGANSQALADTKVWVQGHPEWMDSTDAQGAFTIPLATVSLGSSFGVRPSPGRGEYATERRGLAAGFTFIEKGSAHRFDASGKHLPGPESFRSLEPRDRVDARPSELPKRSAAGDTLNVLRMGYEIQKVPLASLASIDVGTVNLKLRTFKLEGSYTVKTGRKIEVYLPSDYARLPDLPVLYLLHGGSANETYWRQNCKFLDSLNTFADRSKVQPMIIITPSAGGNTNYGGYGKTADPFYADLTGDIRSYVESHYKVDTARTARAISGLSMGAMQTWNLTLFYPKLWGWSLPMSGGLYKSPGFTAAKMKSDAAGKVIDVAALNELEFFKVYTNPTDIAFGDTDTTTQVAAELGIHHTTDFTTKTSGGHTDPYWNEVFRKYAPLLFK